MRLPTAHSSWGFAAAIAAALLAVALLQTPRAQAQAVDPAIFLGDATQATVDGEPLAAGVALEAVSQGGAVIATAEWEGNFWFITVPGEHSVVLFRLGAAVSAPYDVVSGAVSDSIALELVTPGAAQQRQVALGGGWNLAGWLGPTTAVADAVSAILGVVEDVFVWDASQQAFLRFRPGAPAFLNTATEIRPGDGVWVRARSAATWSQPYLPGLAQARSVRLQAGFNLIVWTGPDGAAPDAAFGSDPAVLANAYTFDAVGQGFRRYQPGALAILNTLNSLPFGVGVWVEAATGVDFDLPGSEE